MENVYSGILSPWPAKPPDVLSIVIPTLEAAATLERTIEAVDACQAPHQIVVADGGSTDDTRRTAERAGAMVVAAPRGRGAQLAAGAAAATGEWLLFLHADTVPGAGWAKAVSRFVSEPANRRRAATFRFALDDPDPRARRLERVVAWRTRVLGLPYGDQGLLIGHPFYEELGGYRPIPLMEDVDLARRIGRRRLAVLDAAAVTSAEGYRRQGYVLRPLRNLACLGLYFLGVPPRLIVPLYR